jgi:hypothetical protein
MIVQSLDYLNNEKSIKILIKIHQESLNVLKEAKKHSYDLEII